MRVFRLVLAFSGNKPEQARGDGGVVGGRQASVVRGGIRQPVAGDRKYIWISVFTSEREVPLVSRLAGEQAVRSEIFGIGESRASEFGSIGGGPRS